MSIVTLYHIINRVSEGTIQAISSQVEALYLDNSRADVNETLTGLIMEAVVTPVPCPERLAEELSMLVAILHSNVGSEVGECSSLASFFSVLFHILVTHCVSCSYMQSGIMWKLNICLFTLTS